MTVPGSSVLTYLRVSSCISLNSASEESDTSTLVIRNSFRRMLSVLQQIERPEVLTSSCERIFFFWKALLFSESSFF